MRKIILTVAAALLLFAACKKSNDTRSSSKTVQSISGSYNLVGITWTSLGITANVFDSLPACEKDDILRFDTDGSAHEIDAKVTCIPPVADSVTTWGLSANGDSLYLAGSPYLIKSWDGTTLIITGIANPGPPVVIGTTTLVKQ
jgi:hypothetical protein